MRAMSFLFKWPAAAVLTVFWGLASILFAFIPPRGRGMNRCGRLWARGMLFCWGVKVRVLNPPGRSSARVVMPNHRSLVDIPVIFVAVPDPVVFLAKKSLFRIPFLGWAMSAGGFIPVDRADRSTALATFKRAKEELREGLSILLFPEETRSTVEGLLPFKKGGFLLSHATGAPILPMGIHGADAVIGKSGHRVRRGTVSVCFGEEIPLDKSVAVPELMARVRADLETCIARASAEPAP
jgi:1-acyl-sn-glycerol-3-phosphate acyltransferase